MTSRPVYLDYAAAAPVDPRVAAVMTACLTGTGTFGNPHARDHVYGWEAAEAVERARAQVAALVGATPPEIIFTSGATESNNLAWFGLTAAAAARGDRRRHLVTSAVEHRSVLEVAAALEKRGYAVTYLTPRPDGSLTAAQVAAALRPDTLLVSVAQANSEVGTISDTAAIAAVCRAHGCYFHTDCAQSAGFTDNDFDHGDVALATLTAEKIGGPKGVGALYMARAQAVPLQAQILGGGQEHGYRGGTVPVHQVAGLGAAFALMREEGAADAARIRALRARLRAQLADLPGIIFNGGEPSVPGILSVSFAGVDGSRLIPALRDTAASSGSACASAELRPSYVLTALGRSEAEARASLRLSLGRFTVETDVARAAADIRAAVLRLRAAAGRES